MCDSLCLNTVRRTCQGGFTDQSWWRTLQSSDLSGAFANAHWNSFLWLKSQKFSMDFCALCRHASGYTVTSYGPETMCKNNHLKQTHVHINIPSYHMKMSSIWYKSYVNVVARRSWYDALWGWQVEHQSSTPPNIETQFFRIPISIPVWKTGTATESCLFAQFGRFPPKGLQSSTGCWLKQKMIRLETPRIETPGVSCFFQIWMSCMKIWRSMNVNVWQDDSYYSMLCGW